MKRFITISSVVTKARQLVAANEGFKNIDFVVGMSRGGLIPAALIATEINKPLVAIYINKKDEIFFDRGGWIDGRNILFVDDVCRTGSTLELAIKCLKKCSAAKITTLTLFDVLSINKTTSPDIAHRVSEDVTLPWDHDRD